MSLFAEGWLNNQQGRSKTKQEGTPGWPKSPRSIYALPLLDRPGDRASRACDRTGFASGHLRRFRSHKKRSLLTTLGAYRPGLVTSSERSKVEPILRASAIYEKFDAMVFGEDVTAHQPAPDPYLLVAQKLGVRESCSRTRNLDLRAPPLRGSKLSESRNRRILQKLSYCLCAVKRILQRLSGPEFSRSHASLLLPQITSYRKAFSISP